MNALAKGTKGQVHNEMCRYKSKWGPLPLEVIKNVPVSERLPALAKMYGVDKMSIILGNYITKTLANFNLRVGMNAEQVFDLSVSLIESAEEDQLAIQDILLFLDGMVKYKYGKVYDRMDMPTFYEMLEVYREQRHQALMGVNDELQVNYKAAGDTNRLSNDVEKDKNRSAMELYLKSKI